MAIIGTFKKDGAGYAGTVETLTLKAKITFDPAGIDVHKKMLAVVVSDVEVDAEYRFERRMFGCGAQKFHPAPI
jgi:uncharacterized protein (DUF736 family)